MTFQSLCKTKTLIFAYHISKQMLLPVQNGEKYTCKQVKIIVFCRDLDWLRKWRESLANEKAKQCVPFTDNLSDSF